MGGVSEYTRLVAEGLANAGEDVHVWAPGEGDKAEGKRQKAASGKRKAEGERQEALVNVHRELGTFRPRDLRRVGKQLDQFRSPRRILVQWVPHGFGYRSMNLPFCSWLWWRARAKRDQVELIVHEPYLPFAGSWKQHGAAAVHRLMTACLLRSPRCVWLSTPAWKEKLTPYALGRRIPFHWLPLTSNVPEIDNPRVSREIRNVYASSEELLLGHYGTYSPQISEFLLKSLSLLLPKHDRLAMLLMGPGGQQLRERLAQMDPKLSRRVHATGELSIADSTKHISACDILLQPYPDGVSSRRTTMMAGLFLQVPTVTTQGETTEPLWAESGAVALTPAGDVNAFVASVERLLVDQTERRRLAIASSQLYQERFDIRHVIGALRAYSQGALQSML